MIICKKNGDGYKKILNIPEWDFFDTFTSAEGEKHIVVIESKNPDYCKAYNVLMDYWDCIPEEERHNANERIEEALGGPEETTAPVSKL